jgi:hypothetical protein
LSLRALRYTASKLTGLGIIAFLGGLPAGLIGAGFTLLLGKRNHDIRPNVAMLNGATWFFYAYIAIWLIGTFLTISSLLRKTRAAGKTLDQIARLPPEARTLFEREHRL